MSVNKVKVYGKAMNRTVLGIVKAYQVMNPECRLHDVNGAFSKAVAQVRGVKDCDLQLLVTYAEAIIENKRKDKKVFFSDPDEVVCFKGGTKGCVSAEWVEEKFNELVKAAELLGIEVASFEKTEKCFEKGSYSLEYINGYVPPVSDFSKAAPVLQSPVQSASEAGAAAASPAPSSATGKAPEVRISERVVEKVVEKVVYVDKPVVVEKVKTVERVEYGFPEWFKWLMALAFVALLALFLFGLIYRNCESCNRNGGANGNGYAAPLAAAVAEPVHDTVYVERTDTVVKVMQSQLQDIQRSFNSAKFESGSADLTDDTKFALYDLQRLMNRNPKIRLMIVGHTSADGDEAKNLELSKLRAKVAYDFLVGRGIDSTRLQYQGRGSSEPIDALHPERNRRTEFNLIDASDSVSAVSAAAPAAEAVSAAKQ